MLTVSSLSQSFGGVYANKDIDLTVGDGQIRGVIGPNGAGKSTLFNLISGQLPTTHGRIELDGVRIDRLSPHRRARLGIAMVFQGARLFPGMSVFENVEVGATAVTRAGALSGALRLPRQNRDERHIRRVAAEAIDRVGLNDWSRRRAEELPLGQQRRVQVARALAGQPHLLLLDEPASGMRGDERAGFVELVRALRSDGMSVLLIEHDVAMVTSVVDRITVLDLGEVIAEGTPEEIQADDRVIAAYLGAQQADHA